MNKEKQPKLLRIGQGLTFALVLIFAPATMTVQSSARESITIHTGVTSPDTDKSRTTCTNIDGEFKKGETFYLADEAVATINKTEMAVSLSFSLKQYLCNGVAAKYISKLAQKLSGPLDSNDYTIGTISVGNRSGNVFVHMTPEFAGKEIEFMDQTQPGIIELDNPESK